MRSRACENTSGAGFLVTCLALWAGAAASASAGEARNVILLVADGAGFNSFIAASYYQHGKVGLQPYDQRGWVHYGCSTFPLNRSGSATGNGDQDANIVYDPAKAWDPRFEWPAADGSGPFKGYNYLKKTYTDSAAAATAMATGVKTYNSSINFANHGSGEPLVGQTIAELAKSLGKSVGIVTSVQWCHATPAALGGAHNAKRDNYFYLASELLEGDWLDVIMGAGHPEHDSNGAPRVPSWESDYKYVGGSVTWQSLRGGTHPGGWKLVETRAQFEALMNGPTPARVVGTARVPSTLQQERQTRDWDGDGLLEAEDKRVAPVYGDRLNAGVPTLATMVRGALNVLDNNEKGFFLMIEGGAVDWANHARQPARMIEEMIDFNKAVEAVAEWVETHSSWEETLVIVTADHETGMVWGVNSHEIAFEPVLNRGAGQMPGLWHNSGGHTNSLVPLRARGAGVDAFARKVAGRDPVYGSYVTNTAIFETMRQAMESQSFENGLDLADRPELQPSQRFAERGSESLKAGAGSPGPLRQGQVLSADGDADDQPLERP